MSDQLPNKKNRDSLMSNFENFYNSLDNFFTNTGIVKSELGGSFKLDVQEKDNEYIIEAELPGIKKEEISLDLKNERLNISISREENIEEEKKNYIHKERKVSSMSRSLFLSGSKSEGVKAKLEEGVLNITVPKEQQDESSKIEIE